MQMEMVTDVQIDLYGEMQFYMASAKQGDKATRYLRVQLMNNGNEFQIPDDVVLIANIKKPDGKFCYNECKKQDNRVMVQLTNQALAAAGTAYCDIEMRSRSGELILSSAAFTIEIESSMRNEDAIESSNEMTFLDRKVQAYIDNLLATKRQVLDTEEAFKAAEKARALAEAARIREEDIRKGNEQERITAERTRQQQLVRMQKATSDADTAAGKAGKAAEAATDATERAEELFKTEEQMQDMYEQMLDIKGGIGNVISGGNPYSIDAMCCDGGTPFTTDECEADAGRV